MERLSACAATTIVGPCKSSRPRAVEDVTRIYTWGSLAMRARIAIQRTIGGLSAKWNSTTKRASLLWVGTPQHPVVHVTWGTKWVALHLSIRRACPAIVRIWQRRPIQTTMGWVGSIAVTDVTFRQRGIKLRLRHNGKG